jgi:hypothetical protein
LNQDIKRITLSNDLTHTWEYSSLLKDREDIDYASIYCNNSSINEMCPEEYKKEWNEVKRKYRANLISIKEAKINLDKICLYDLIPTKVMKEYAEIKNKISQYVFDNYKKPAHYDLLVKTIKMLNIIESQTLNFDEELRKKYSLGKKGNRIAYNALGSITGRLSSNKGSFPILNFKRDYRGILLPKNDVFLELDYNAAEFRVLTALAKLPQPDYDLHEFNRVNIFNGEITRDEAKRQFFSWSYDLKKTNEQLEKIYKRDLLISEFYNGQKIKTIYGNEIESDLEHSLNYLIQSTSAYLFLEQCVKIDELLKDKKSLISFLIHDSIVIDLDKKEKYLIPQIHDIYRKTRLGDFLVSIKIGKNFGDMKKVEL